MLAISLVGLISGFVLLLIALIPNVSRVFSVYTSTILSRMAALSAIGMLIFSLGVIWTVVWALDQGADVAVEATAILVAATLVQFVWALPKSRREISASRSQLLAADASAIFNRVADRRNLAKTDPRVVSLELSSPETISAGSVFRWRIQNKFMLIERNEKVVEFEPNKRFVVRGDDGIGVVVDLAEVSPGETNVTITSQFTAPIPGKMRAWPFRPSRYARIQAALDAAVTLSIQRLQTELVSQGEKQSPETSSPEAKTPHTGSGRTRARSVLSAIVFIAVLMGVIVVVKLTAATPQIPEQIKSAAQIASDTKSLLLEATSVQIVKDGQVPVTVTQTASSPGNVYQCQTIRDLADQIGPDLAITGSVSKPFAFQNSSAISVDSTSGQKFYVSANGQPYLLFVETSTLDGNHEYYFSDYNSSSNIPAPAGGCPPEKPKTVAAHATFTSSGAASGTLIFSPPQHPGVQSGCVVGATPELGDRFDYNISSMLWTTTPFPVGSTGQSGSIDIDGQPVSKGNLTFTYQDPSTGHEGSITFAGNVHVSPSFAVGRTSQVSGDLANNSSGMSGQIVHIQGSVNC